MSGGSFMLTMPRLMARRVTSAACSSAGSQPGAPLQLSFAKTEAGRGRVGPQVATSSAEGLQTVRRSGRSEEHTSELQSRENIVCRLLLEKKKKIIIFHN